MAALAYADGQGAAIDHARIRRKPNQIPVPAQHDLGHADRARELCMLGKMQRLAVHRDRDARPHHLVHLHQFGAAWVSRDMDGIIAFGHDLDAEACQRVLDTRDGLLVAGDDF